MFVAFVQFPPIQAGKDAEFRDWFSGSNKELAKHKGFISRQLLKPREGGNYTAIVQHESYETSLAMQNSASHSKAHESVGSLLNGMPTPSFYDVLIG